MVSDGAFEYAKNTKVIPMLPTNLPSNQQYVLALVRESLGIPTEYPTSVDPYDIVKIILHNRILLTVYPALKAQASRQDSNVENTAAKLLRYLHSYMLPDIGRTTLQDYEGNRILEALSGAGLDCIPLKGWELRNYYPERIMRHMCDLDILVRPYEYSKIRDIMEGLGFSASHESSWKHDNFTKDVVLVEMHKRLTDDSSIIGQWENSVWDRALRHNGNIFRMSNDDYYIFHFLHLKKDFANGSLILKRIIDTWLLRNSVDDRDSVNSLLESFGMSLFHERMVRLAGVCMGEYEMDDDSRVMLDYAMNYSIKNSSETYKLGRIASMSGGKSMWLGKLKSFTAAIFLPFHRMKAHYPLLKKVPILLPYFWMKRIFSLLSGNTQKYRQMLDYSDIDKSDYETAKRFLRAGGIENK